MKWQYRKSALKRWIARSRQDGYTGCSQVVFAILPKKVGYGGRSLVYWLSPVTRTRESSTWKSSSCLDPGCHYWWGYYDPPENAWSVWLATRPLHHLAGTINFVVYWSWFLAFCIGASWLLLHPSGVLEFFGL